MSVGIHDNYVRYLMFAEREIMPRAEIGADAFYAASGRLAAEFGVHMALMGEFAATCASTATPRPA